VSGQARFVALAFVGAVLMALGWYDAAGTVAFSDQARSGALATAGSMAVCTAVVLRTLAARQAVERRLADLVRRAEHLSPTIDVREGGLSVGALVATEAMGRYHRSSCPLAAGKAVRAATRTAHEAAGRLPCGICGP
jgi:hypothetical protein